MPLRDPRPTGQTGLPAITAFRCYAHDYRSFQSLPLSEAKRDHVNLNTAQGTRRNDGRTGPKDNGLCTTASPSAMPLPDLQVGLRASKRVMTLAQRLPMQRHSGVVLLALLAYRCGGSARIALGANQERTGFPFHPSSGRLFGTPEAQLLMVVHSWEACLCVHETEKWYATAVRPPPASISTPTHRARAPFPVLTRPLCVDDRKLPRSPRSGGAVQVFGFQRANHR